MHLGATILATLAFGASIAHAVPIAEQQADANATPTMLQSLSTKQKLLGAGALAAGTALIGGIMTADYRQHKKAKSEAGATTKRTAESADRVQELTERLRAMEKRVEAIEAMEARRVDEEMEREREQWRAEDEAKAEQERAEEEERRRADALSMNKSWWGVR